MDEIITTLDVTPGATVRKLILSIPTGNDAVFGCNEAALNEMLKSAQEMYPHLRHAIVRDWVWFDVVLSEKELVAFTKNGLFPTFLFSDNVREVEQNREFEWVRTTPLKAFEAPSYFMTRNTCYLLVGQGKRVRIAPGVAGELFNPKNY